MFFNRFIGMHPFQASLSEVERKAEMAELQLRSTVREILILEAGMENLEQQMKVLHDRCVSISKENTELQDRIREEDEDAQMALARFNAYRSKMEAHSVAVQHAKNNTEVQKVLEERRALVQRLTQEKEQLREDLENPNGNTVQMAKVGNWTG